MLAISKVTLLTASQRSQASAWRVLPRTLRALAQLLHLGASLSETSVFRPSHAGPPVHALPPVFYFEQPDFSGDIKL